MRCVLNNQGIEHEVIKILQVIALAALASPALAQSVANDGYARDASTVVVKNPLGLWLAQRPVERRESDR